MTGRAIPGVGLVVLPRAVYMGFDPGARTRIARHLNANLRAADAATARA